jgi:hypothetical protein
VGPDDAPDAAADQLQQTRDLLILDAAIARVKGKHHGQK